MRARYRLIATDLDGTLLRSNLTVSPRARRALEHVRSVGARLVFTTGRPPRWMAPVAEATGHTGVAICANGALLYDMTTETVIGENNLEPEAAVAVVSALRHAIPDLVFAVERGERFGHEPSFRPAARTPEGTLVAAIEDLVREPVAKLLAFHPGMSGDELIRHARDIAGHLAATFTHSSNRGLLEISAAGVSKAMALERLAEADGITEDEVIAFGDMPNDLPMLLWAGHGVAVANAHPDVLAAADEVTASNDDDGVTLVLEREFR